MTSMHDSKPQIGQGPHPVTFTPREQDVLACVISGRSAKTIADLLRISTKTVETHIHNVMEKLGRHSRQDIVRYIEASPLLLHLKKHYHVLIMQYDYDRVLQDIQHRMKQQNPTTHPLPHVLILREVHTRLSDHHSPMEARGLIKDLSTAGIIVRQAKLSRSEVRSERSMLQNKTHYTLGIQMPLDKSPETAHLTQDTPSSLTSASPTPSLFLRLSGGRLARPGNDEHTLIPVGACRALMVFALLQAMLPHLSLEPLIASFKVKWQEVLHETIENAESVDASQEPHENHAPTPPHNPPLWHNWLWVALFGMLCVVMISMVMWWRGEQAPPSVRSTLSVPDDSNLLHRPHPLKEIETKLKAQKGIATVVLVGIGGSGKTTLARLYAKQQRLPVVWEINAETQSALLASFESLTYALSQSAEEKAEWERVKNTENTQERAKKLILLAQRKLKECQSWHLVFDNVDNLTALLSFFPHDPEIWGTGAIIITTRNAHIQDNVHINSQHVITVGHLHDQEKYNLFINVSKGDPNPALIKKTQLFLQRIPPFPLDVSIAANYIRNTKISYADYLECLQCGTKDFENSQVNLLHETSHYHKTRYNIITSTIKELVTQNPECIVLLLLISIIEAQDIPKDFLIMLKPKNIVERFIHDMHKYSLVHYEKRPENQEVMISIHRSTQEIILKFVNATLSTREREKFYDHITEALPDYLAPIISTIDLLKIRCYSGHLLMALKQKSLLNALHEGIIYTQLGCMHYAMGDMHNVESYLETGLISLRHHNKHKPSLHIAQALSYLGVVLRRSRHYEKSKKLLEESLALYKQHTSQNTTDIAWVLLHLGKTYMRLSQYVKAEKLLEQSITIYAQLRGEWHDKVPWGLIYLSDLRYALGNYRGAKVLCEKAVKISVKIFQYCHAAWSITRLAIVCKSLGDLAKAQKLLEQSYASYKQHLPENQDLVDWTIPHLSDLYRQYGCYDKAIAYINESIVMSAQYYGPHHIQTVWNKVCLAQIYIDLKDYAKAKTLLEESLHIHQKTHNISHLRVAWINYHLANVHKGLGAYQQALELFQKSFAVYAKHYGKNHIECVRILCDWGHLYHVMHEDTQAEKMIHQALAIYQREQHPEAHKALTYLGEICQKKAGYPSLNNTEKLVWQRKARQYFQQAHAALKKAQFPESSAHFAHVNAKMKQV